MVGYAIVREKITIKIGSGIYPMRPLYFDDHHAEKKCTIINLRKFICFNLLNKSIIILNKLAAASYEYELY